MNLDDQLLRRVKIRAAEQGTTVTSLVELEALLDDDRRAMPRPAFQVPVLASAGGLVIEIDLTDNSVVQRLLDAVAGPGRRATRPPTRSTLRSLLSATPLWLHQIATSESSRTFGWSVRSTPDPPGLSSLD